MKIIISLFCICFYLIGIAQEKGQDIMSESRWRLGSSDDISWDVIKDNRLPHSDNLEMSGKQVSTIITYSIDSQKQLKVSKQIIWPSMIIKYDFRSYLMQKDSVTPQIILNGQDFILPSIDKISFDGILHFDYAKGPLDIQRSIFPSVDQSVVFDLWEIQNTASKSINVEVKSFLKNITVTGAENNYTVLTKIDKQLAVLKKGQMLGVSEANSS